MYFKHKNNIDYRKSEKLDKYKLSSDILKRLETKRDLEMRINTLKILSDIYYLIEEITNQTNIKLLDLENDLFFLDSKCKKIGEELKSLDKIIEKDNLLKEEFNFKLKEWERISKLYALYINKIMNIKRLYTDELVSLISLTDFSKRLIYALYQYKDNIEKTIKELELFHNNVDDIIKSYEKEKVSILMFINLIENKTSESLDQFIPFYEIFPMEIITNSLIEELNSQSDALTDSFIRFLKSRLIKNKDIQSAKKLVKNTSSILIALIFNYKNINVSENNWEKDFKPIFSRAMRLTTNSKAVYLTPIYTNSRKDVNLLLFALSKSELELFNSCLFLNPDLIPQDVEIYYFKD